MVKTDRRFTIHITSTVQKILRTCTDKQTIEGEPVQESLSTIFRLFIICCLFWNLVTIIIAFVPVHVYTLKFGEKITFYNFFLKKSNSVFVSISKRSYPWKMRGYAQFSFSIQ